MSVILNRLTFTGQPRSKKNSKDIAFNKKTKRRFIKSNDNVVIAENSAILQMRMQNVVPTITERVGCKFTFHLQCKSDSENSPDLSNLMELPADSMEKAGVIVNDRQICSLDGSRRVFLCDGCEERGRYVKGDKKGQLKDRCGMSHKCTRGFTEIELTRFDDTPAKPELMVNLAEVALQDS